MNIRPKVSKVRMHLFSEGVNPVSGRLIHLGNPLWSTFTPSAFVSGCPERYLVKCNLLLLKYLIVLSRPLSLSNLSKRFTAVSSSEWTTIDSFSLENKTDNICLMFLELKFIYVALIVGTILPS